MSSRDLPFSPWWLVAAGAVAMGAAGFYQFTWSSLREPIGVRLGATETSIGTVFTLFVLFQTVSQFPAGWIRDRYGPRWPLFVAGVFLASGFALTALSTSVAGAYLGYSIGGIGAGATYTVAVNTPIKWFDAHRGLATGLVSSTYGAVSFLAIPAVRTGVNTDVKATLLALGGVAGVGVLVAVPVLRDPGHTADNAGSTSDGATAASDDRDYTWRETVRTWQFWLMYLVFAATNVVSLAVVGKAVSFAQHLGLSAAVATGSASLIALADASGILVSGMVSDRVGEVRTTGVSLVCSGVVLGLAVLAGDAGFGLGFVGLLAAVIFFRSPVFSVFPPLIGKYYGPSHSSTNFALLYTGKLWGGIGGGLLASLLISAVGWSATFLAGAVLVAAAGIAAFRLRPVAPDAA